MRGCLLGFLLAHAVALNGCAGSDGDGGRNGAGGAQSSAGTSPAIMSSGGAHQTACENFCVLRQEAACNATDTHAECFAACTEEGDLEAHCASEFAALVTCATGAPMLCNGQAARIAVDCSAQSSAYQACMEANDWVSLSLVPCHVYSCQGLCHIGYGCVECLENIHCGPTEECSLIGNVCRQRCLDDGDCPGAFCASTGVCGDPVGTPCEDYFDCEGGRCIDVDANLTTVDQYCTISCTASCPEGYTCQEFECRRL